MSQPPSQQVKFFTGVAYKEKTKKTIKGNLKFNTDLTLFGVMKERVISKVNRKENILKLRNNDSYDSIYPMLDEFGYMVVDYFIFKSNWDLEFYYETNLPNKNLIRKG
jgi:hypothetical protein